MECFAKVLHSIILQTFWDGLLSFLELPSGIEQLVEAQIQCALGHGESSKVAQRTHQRDQVHR